VRIRVGYFRNIRAKPEHVVAFWERVMREKGIEAELLERDPDLWRETVNAHSQRQNDFDHHIEHWICELWDDETRTWQLVDANADFVRALNHDGAGIDRPNGRDYAFIKRQKYEETAPAELAALDELASLLAAQRLDQLAEFYWATPALRIEAAEGDPHSVVFRAAS
jgi:hypothetical protein